MVQETWFSSGGERVRSAFEDALSWCERCSVVTDAPGVGERADPLWTALRAQAQRVRAAVLSNLELADADVLQPLQDAGCVRRFADGAELRGHFMWFERGSEVRFFLAPGPLRTGTVTGPGVWLFARTDSHALPEGLEAILDACSSSLPLVPGEQAAEPRAAFYSRAVPSVREVLGRRTVVDWFELEAEEQELALWSALIGEGPVDLGLAVRLCAERLRIQGFLHYQVLRQDGRVYTGIEERLLSARRRTDLFDRPRSGFVRAIQPSLDELTAEQWRDCVIGALEHGTRVDREQAVRMGFARAQEVYGIHAQRLRGGGRAEQALRSAINSSVRQGHLARDGAAYLIRVSENIEPTLRGALPPESFEEGPPVPTPVSADSSIPAPTSAQAGEPSDGVVIESLPSAVPAPASVRDAPPPAPVPPLERPVWELDLPTRALNWAERQQIRTVRELVSWHPDRFASERNVGRRTVRETRELIEAHLGCSWEEAYAALHTGTQPPEAPTSAEADEEVDSATEALTAGGGAGWARLAASLTAEEQAIPLADVALPTRVKNFARAERLTQLGELFRFSYAALATRPNLGRKSLNDTLDAVRDSLNERAAPPEYTSFLHAWQSQLAAFEPIPRMIVSHRAGMHGSRETLEDLGAMLGVTRERVRQIEARVIERLRERTRWRALVDEKLAAAFGAGRAVPLGLLAQDAWWGGVDSQDLLLDYVVRRVFEDELFVLHAPSGKHYLTRFDPSELAGRVESAKQRVSKLEYPAELSAIEAILHSEADSLDPVLYAELEHVIAELLHTDPEKPGLALGYGRYRDDEVIAFLAGQDAPVPIALVEERCGRGRFPHEVLYFKRGVVGLKRHFPDFDGWMQRLVPAAVEVMRERPAGRQWLVPEIHEILRERGLVPEWLGHWHLASLLRVSGEVDYLGRLRIASKDSGVEQRLQYEELLEDLLEAEGRPLEFKELLTRARVQTDVSEGAATMMVGQAPFVRLDEARIGLVERDIPGGPSAVAAAAEIVVKALSETQRGLTPHQATQLVHTLGGVHTSWTRQLVTSVLRNEPAIRIDRSKNIGLDDWDDARCPARVEFIRREVLKAGGRVPVRDLCTALADTYGRAPDRSGLGVLVSDAGLTLLGDVVCEPISAEAEGPPSRRSVELPGIPTELREMFEELVQEPLFGVQELRAKIQEHVDAIEHEHRVNEFVDLRGAREVAAQCHTLLHRWDALPTPERHLVNAAIRYFVSFEDIEHDFDIGGLDDDKQIMNAVLTHLGVQDSYEVQSAAAAS